MKNKISSKPNLFFELSASVFFFVFVIMLWTGGTFYMFVTDKAGLIWRFLLKFARIASYLAGGVIFTYWLAEGMPKIGISPNPDTVDLIRFWSPILLALFFLFHTMRSLWRMLGWYLLFVQRCRHVDSDPS